MKIRICSFVKSPDKNVKPLEEEYKKRLSKSFGVEFLEIRREPAIHSADFQKDWVKILTKKGKDYLILLDENGKSFTSVQLAKQLDCWKMLGRNLMFVIGGPDGFPEDVKKEADFLLSLSNLTLPHKLVRLFLVEALYRANDITEGGPYHREGVRG